MELKLNSETIKFKVPEITEASKPKINPPKDTMIV
jgi:hypothetical protein